MRRPRKFEGFTRTVGIERKPGDERVIDRNVYPVVSEVFASYLNQRQLLDDRSE